MTEDQVWVMYHRERAVEEVLQKKFLDMDGDADEQLAVMVKLQQQHGRVQILEELVTLAYIQHEDDEEQS